MWVSTAGQSLADQETKTIYRKKLQEFEVNQYRNEVSILSHIEHSGIVDIVAFLEEENYLYIVMDLMEGGEVSFINALKFWYSYLIIYN